MRMNPAGALGMGGKLNISDLPLLIGLARCMSGPVYTTTFCYIFNSHFHHANGNV